METQYCTGGDVPFLVEQEKSLDFGRVAFALPCLYRCVCGRSHSFCVSVRLASVLSLREEKAEAKAEQIAVVSLGHKSGWLTEPGAVRKRLPFSLRECQCDASLWTLSGVFALKIPTSTPDLPLSVVYNT